MTSTWSIMLIAAIGSVCAAQPALNLGTEVVRKYGYVLTASRWTEREIDVCWESLGDSTAAERELTRQAVAANWEKHSRVRFRGWLEQCTSGSPGVHIAVRDSVAETQALGNYLDQMPRGLTLNFTMSKWQPPCAGLSRAKCLTAVAAHEFGHVLGFSHEQNRPDRPDTCRERRQGAHGDYLITEYDSDSIMNYCNQGWTGQGGLSARDIRAVRTFYGAS